MASAERQQRFLALLEEHRRLLYKVARAYGRTAPDRDDLVQEMAVQAWKSFPRYDERWRFSTWLYRIALNVAISFQRRQSTRRQHLAPEGAETLEVGQAEDDWGEDVALLYRFIGQLDALNRALMLMYLDGLSQAEIAEVLGITLTNVSTRVGRLKQKLRDDFRNIGNID
ncbi:MAG: RNA polymerase sigma factor [Myxococcaceae bacterium]